MTSDDSLSLILRRRLDEIERKLDRMLEKLRTPAAIGGPEEQIFGVTEQVRERRQSDKLSQCTQ
jgi:hypothetical protein